jgi:hypothetical protein
VIGLLLAVRAAAPADEIHWTITGQTSVTFDWRGAQSAIRFGKFPWALNDSVVAVTPSPIPDSSPGPFWEARITGLQENTRYYYRIGNMANRLFRTAVPRGSSNYWFAEEADVGSTLSWSTVGIIQSMIFEDNPDLPQSYPRFVLVPGDLSYSDQGSVADVDQHFNDVMPWSSLAAYMPAWGNHEWATAADASLDNLNNYEGRFDFPNSQTSPAASVAVGNGPGEDWYWFDYGNVRFISLPEPFDGTWTDWATKVRPIMADAQADPAITFIVTFGHRPSWSSGADHGGDSALAAYMAGLRNSYPKFGLCLQAHSHHYERTDPTSTNGILYIVGSTGGSTLGGLTANQPSWSAFRSNHLHHLRVHVQQDRIDGYVICGPDGSGSTVSCEQGSIMDSWTVLSAALVGVPAPAASVAGLHVRPEPNPARGAVSFRIEVDVAGEHVLEVLDLSGRRVRRLASGWEARGTRSVGWDGLDESGAPAPAGTYLVRLRSASRSAQSRVTLLR